MDSSTPVVWIAKLPHSPLGEVWVAVTDKGVMALDFWQDEIRFRELVASLKAGEQVRDSQRLAEVLGQVAEYLDGTRKNFDIAIDWSVLSSFQRDVLQKVNQIPYGKTSTYSQIAKQLGKPGAVRAVGRANASNPIPLIIPCHRVLGSDGRLHGYSAPGGLETKAWLLRREGSWLI